MTPQTAFLVPLLPLAGFVIAGLLGKRLGKSFTTFVCCGVMLAAFAVSVGLFVGHEGHTGDSVGHSPASPVVAYEWLRAGDLSVDVAFLVDPLSLVMLLVITGVGTLIHIYSASYMHDDAGYARYFAYLNLFVFFMLILVLAESLPLMFVGWEGVGLCSYLLIGFWHHKPSAADAGLKAFLVNRVGDFGFILAMLIGFGLFGTLSFTAIAHAAPEVVASHGAAPVSLMALFLFLAATGKSAQIPLYIWLPDAMEGPTPVSALIHAATMVTSGIYMMSRLFPLFLEAPDVLWLVALVGGLTAALAASMGLVANDIKKVLAYSTISQLGYMFLGLGVGAATAGMFHLVTHAFFKACLFLGAGAVMHAVGNETDMRKMGDLRKKIPITWATMMAATLAIVGCPLLAGFVSKDAILLAAFQKHAWVPFLLGVMTVGLTSFYMFRLCFMTFYGSSRMDAKVRDHAHDAPLPMAVALVPLAAMAVIGGALNWPSALGGSERFGHFITPVVMAGRAAAEHPHMSLPQELLFSFALMVPAVFGALLAYRWYATENDGAERFAARFGGVYKMLDQKWYVDEIYGRVAVGGLMGASRFMRNWLELIIDGLVNLTGIVAEVIAEVLRAFHRGLVREYALYLTAGAAVLLVWAVL